MKLMSVVPFLALLVGCQSTKQIENSYNEAYLESSADLIFSSPNFSSPHIPPIISGFAYLESYSMNEFCSGNRNLIGKVSVTRKNKTQFSKIPSGDIVVNAGYHAMGAGGLKGNTYYGFNVDPHRSYKITLTESRPLVTSYSVMFEEISGGAVSRLRVLNGVHSICQ